MESEKNVKEQENRAKLVNNSGRKNDDNDKEPKIRWLTKSIAEELDRETLLRVTLQEFIIYVIFLIIVTIFITGLRSKYVYYLTKGLTSQFTEKLFYTVNDVEITFDEIRTAADFWNYLEHHFLKSIYWESTYSVNPKINENEMNILGENRVLGVPRIRQVKMENNSCIVHEHFRRFFLKCFDSYHESREDKETFGLGTGTAWIYSDRSITKSIRSSGSISSYGGGGYYVDFRNNKNETIQIIQDLKNNLWVTRGTRAVFLDFSVYNANTNIFGVCKLLFEFPTVGGVIPKADIQSIRLLRLHNSYDYFLWVCEILFYCFIVFYILRGVRQLIYFKIGYFMQFWTYMDLVVISCSIAGAVISCILWIKEDTDMNLIKENPDKYGNLEYSSYLSTLKNDLFAIDLFFIYVKLFEYLNFNRTMAQLNNTLHRCAWDILGFSIMFFIIFFAFAVLGYLLFGSKIDSFSNFGVAMFTLLQTILGDFDYGELEKANRYLAPIYFLSYIFLVFFVLLNMFLAIINDTYADVKTEISITPDEMQMSEYLKQLLNKALTKCGCARFLKGQRQTDKTELNTTIKQIRDALAKCGFSNLEIEMFFTRYNISPLADMHVQDTEKLASELESILRDSTKAEKARYVRIEDFLEQQKKLGTIDEAIEKLVLKMQNLLTKLETMENVKKLKQ